MKLKPDTRDSEEEQTAWENANGSKEPPEILQLAESEFVKDVLGGRWNLENKQTLANILMALELTGPSRRELIRMIEERMDFELPDEKQEEVSQELLSMYAVQSKHAFLEQETILEDRESNQ